jgi:hypothetical protein
VFSVCKVKDYSEINLNQPFVFTGATDEEKSLVCPAEYAPCNVIERDDGWKAMRIKGQLDFSLIGILAKIASLLAAEKISIFALSTFNTDYILTKENSFEEALDILEESGYQIMR